MSKRFTDTSKWKDKWFFELPLWAKCLWFYLLDNCDSSGVFESNWKIFSFYIGDSINEESFLKYFSEKITPLKESKFIINNFIEFQYDALKPTNPPHKSVLKILREHGLCTFDTKEIEGKNGKSNVIYENINIMLPQGLPKSKVTVGQHKAYNRLTPQDKDTVKDQVTVEGELKTNIRSPKSSEPIPEFNGLNNSTILNILEKIPQALQRRWYEQYGVLGLEWFHLEIMNADTYYLAKGRLVKNWGLTLTNWFKNAKSRTYEIKTNQSKQMSQFSPAALQSNENPATCDDDLFKNAGIDLNIPGDANG